MSDASLKLDFYHHQPSEIPISQFQNQLDVAENNFANLTKQDKDTILAYLNTLDSVHDKINYLQTNQDVDITGELIRFEVLRKKLNRKSSAILKQLGGNEVIRKARPSTATENEHSWWFLDQYVLRRRKKIVANLVKGFGILASIGLILVILFNTVFAPDPLVIARMKHYDNATFHASEGNYTESLAEVEAGLAIAPDEVDFFVLKGILLERLDRADEAGQWYEKAKEITHDSEYIPATHGKFLLQMNEPESALQFIQEATDMNEEYAFGWLLAGQAHVNLNQVSEAHVAFTKAENYAFEQGYSNIYVAAKMNLASLNDVPTSPEETH